jgi:hypothetical protein
MYPNDATDPEKVTRLPEKNAALQQNMKGHEPEADTAVGERW